MYKRHFILIALGWFLVALFPRVLLISVDPLYLLREYEDKEIYNPVSPRYITPSLIRHHLYYKKDKHRLIIGSSVFRDTLPVDLEKYTGLADTLHLVMDAMNAKEFAATMDVINRSGQIDTIVFSLDPFRYFVENPTPWFPFPYEFYGDNLFEKIRVMATRDCINQSIDILRGRVAKVDPDFMFLAMRDICTGKKFTEFQASFEECRAYQAAQIPQYRQERIDMGHTELPLLLETLKAIDPQVRVHVFISPVFVAGTEHVPLFQNYYSGVLTTLEELAEHSNITVYGFDDIPEITNNMANFHNSNHYGIGINRFMLRALAEKSHILTLNSVHGYLDAVWHNRTAVPIYSDPAQTVSFEGPMDEARFAVFPPPYGPNPLPVLPSSAVPNREGKTP